MKAHKNPLNRSLTIGCALFILSLCLLLSLANLTIYRDYVYKDYKGYIEDILKYTLSRIDGDDLRTCIETGEESPKYKETLLFMDDLMEHFDDIHYFYAILPLNTEDTGNTMSVLSAERYYDRYVDTEGNLYLGWISDDEFDSDTAARMLKILHGDKIDYFEEKTEWGLDYTGAVPIKDSDGSPVAVLAVDIDISFINGMILRYASINIYIICIVGAVYTALFLFWLSRNITKPIRKLEESAVGFIGHSRRTRDMSALNFDPPEIKSDNEIKSLSDAVVQMTDDMRDYVSDIISAEEKAANMKELANRDALTGIRNKTAYDNKIRKINKKIEEGDTKIGLAIIDLNYLKKTNDTYGHDRGDILIRKLSETICGVFSSSPVYRIGGDEFAVLLQDGDYDRFDGLAAAFNKKIELMDADDSLEPWEKVSAALGAAFYDETLDDGMESLFRRADNAMYARKKQMKAGRKGR